MNIEISGVCQAKCQYCMQYRLQKDKKFGSFMSPELFEKILVHLFDIGMLDRGHSRKITLYNWGEPFLNKNINEISFRYICCFISDCENCNFSGDT